jgi:hypothetical protein
VDGCRGLGELIGRIRRKTFFVILFTLFFVFHYSKHLLTSFTYHITLIQFLSNHLKDPNTSKTT